MEEPIFKTQKQGHLSLIEVYPDRLEYSSKLSPLAQARNIPLEHIEQTAFVPKPPGADPNLIDFAVKIKGQPILVMKDLDIGEAKEIQDLIKQRRIAKPQEVREEHPFTLGGRVVKAIKDKKENLKTLRPQVLSRSKVNKSSAKLSGLLPFRR
ncbi:MAG: hypothetical protein FJ044_05250 [Candidatus Cloacimonetes bacterium]|nr:hypothetical protein [Candidatus Cloacimonadota bacterium]